MENKQELPAGWKWVKLGEVCEIIKGKKPILYDENTSNKALPYLTAEVIRYNLKPKWCLESNGDVVRVNKDEIVIIADGSNSGEVFIGFEGALASTMGKLKIINENVSTDFLYLFIKKNFKELNAPKRGSAIPHLEKDIFYNLSIPLPPLSEQKRIAEKLKAMMDEIDEAKASIEKQLEAAKALPSAYLSEVFESPEAQKWEKKKLGEVCKFMNGKFINKENVHSQGTYPVYGANGIIGFTEEKMFEDKLIVIGRVGSCGMVNVTSGPSWITDNTIILKPLNEIYFDFLYWKLKTLRLEELRSSSVQPLITQSSIKSLAIPLPPLSEQKRIASYLKEKIDQAEKLRETLEKELETFNTLPQSILSKAFKGEI